MTARVYPPLFLAALLFGLFVDVSHGQCILDSIKSPVGQGNTGFGVEISVGSDRFLVSARFAAGNDADTGAVHVYRRSGRNVEFEQTLSAPNDAGDDRFGWVTASEDEWIVIGAPLDDERRGAVYVFHHDGETWTLHTKLTAEGGQVGDEFGRAVAIRGNYILVGAPLDDEIGPSAGAAYVFSLLANEWLPTTKLLPVSLQAGDSFGGKIAVEGDIAAISAQLDDEGAEDAGAVYIYRRTNGQWLEREKILAEVPVAGASFGSSIAYRSSMLLVGARNENGHGAAHLFRNQGEVWVTDHRFVATDADAGDGFGGKVAVSEDRILITSTSDTGTEHGTGAVYLYTLYPEEGWYEESKLTQPLANGGDRFGSAMVITRKIALVAGTFDDGRNGRLFVHHLVRPDCRCMAGKVNSGDGAIPDVLYINGSTGGRDRVIEVPEGELLTAYILAPPTGGRGKFVVHANLGMPDRHTVTAMPGEMGRACFSMLKLKGATPIANWNSTGRTASVGASEYFDGSEIPNPDRAPTILFQLNEGDPLNLPAGTVVTFQGAIGDPGTGGSRAGSMTNAVILHVE